jgi:hypothetical protein
METTKTQNFESLKEFYPYYLTEHSNSTSKLLHFIGTSLFFVILIYSLYTAQYQLMWFMPIAGYFFAWIGHFFFEKNKPATFKYPFYSLASDFIMYFDMLRGKVKI